MKTLKQLMGPPKPGSFADILNKAARRAAAKLDRKPPLKHPIGEPLGKVKPLKKTTVPLRPGFRPVNERMRKGDTL